MRNLIVSTFALALLSICALAQTNAPATAAKNANANARAARPHTPIFRANKEQITQAQTILKQRGFYSGDATGKLDDATRDGLRKYQDAEKLKVTGTLNAATLEKMNIAMTDKQKETWRKIQAAANANTQ